MPIRPPPEYRELRSNHRWWCGSIFAGLEAGVRWVLQQKVEEIQAREEERTQQLIDGLEGIVGLQLLGPGDATRQTPTVSFNLKGMSSSEVGLQLDEADGILCRVGLHCAPTAHRTLGTFPHGAARWSIGPFVETDEIDRALEAIVRLARTSS